MYHIQDQVRLFFEGADLLIQLCDSDGIKGGHGHGRDGDPDGDKNVLVVLALKSPFSAAKL